MRVTQGLLFGQALDGVHQHSLAILKQQQQISSGRRWARPSEDPTAAAQSITTRERQATLDRYESATNEARDRLSASASAIQLLSNVLTDAKEVATNSVNSTLTSADRKSLAQRIDSVLSQVLEVGNRQDKYGALFSGTADGSPYEFANGFVTYHGDDGAQSATIGDTLSIHTNINGQELFASEARAKSAYFGGNTGAAPGTGSDSGRDRGTLRVIHGVTTYGNGALGGGDSVSGIRPAATSATGDTVIGPAGAHKLIIDAIGKTIQLNDGAPVPYTGTETDFVASDAAGGTVHLDVTGITNNFQGTVNITSTGSLTTDSGATTTPITFSSNQVIVNSADGTTTNVDTTQLRRAGSEVIDYKGTSDLFQTLIGLRDDLLNYDQMPESTRDASLLARSRELNRNFENALVALSDVGSRLKIADTAAERLGEMKDQVAIVISDLEDTDFSSVVIDYNKSQLALQLAQAAGQRLMNTNFLAFLQ